MVGFSREGAPRAVDRELEAPGVFFDVDRDRGVRVGGLFERSKAQAVGGELDLGRIPSEPDRLDRYAASRRRGGIAQRGAEPP